MHCASIPVIGAQSWSLFAAEQLSGELLVMLSTFGFSQEGCSRIFQQKHFIVDSAGNGGPCIWHTRVCLDHALKKQVHRQGCLEISRLQGK